MLTGWALRRTQMGIMEKKMETLGPLKGIYRDYVGDHSRGYIGIMEKKMETTIVLWGLILG